MPVTSPSRGGMQSCGGVSLGGQSCLAEEIGSPYTPSISPGAVSRPQRPLPRQQRANHVDVDSGLGGEPHGVTDLVGKKSMANTTQPTTTGTGPSDIPFSGNVEVPSQEHPLGEQSAQPAPVALATMASACLNISLLTLLWRPAAPAHRRRRSVCLTRACVALNDMLVAAFNASVDPCDNFYEHVCGGWRESASVYEKHLSLFVDKVKRGSWYFISDRIALEHRAFDDVFFHSERFSKQDPSDVFDTVAMNVSLLHTWMFVARANARIPEEQRRSVTSSYMRQLRESDGYAFFDSQRLAVRIPPLFPMLPLNGSTAAGNLGNYISGATFFVVMCHLLCKARTSLQVEFSCNQIVKNSRVCARVLNREVDRSMNPKKNCDFFSYT
ncbi:hypothetical protein HPB49_014219 [Dermacentor silvarum]|uniref:Uncharacterized protein n=1 Tax=Dermacentor silvarum TaxID=543639 RepID=A0ACB8DIW7_DERSI|nr:hypothetical protein HPB49_014219 [Dermacentor silvarum]